MLDRFIRPLIDPPLNAIGRRLAHKGITANQLTLAGFVFGIAAMGAISLKHYQVGAVFIIINRLFDGLDGAVARQTALSDFGGFLDIVCDFIIYAGVVFAFSYAENHHQFYASFLIFSFIGPVSSFLAYAILAAKRQVTTQDRGVKSFYHLGGICEGTETALVLVLLCLVPSCFNVACLVYGSLCWLTTLGRVHQAWKDFASPPQEHAPQFFGNAGKEPAIRTKDLDPQKPG